MIEPVLLEVEGGSFLMGSEQGADDEKPVHEVRLDPYSIGKFAVTNREYEPFVAATASAAPAGFHDPNFNRPDQPVTGVSWHEAAAFCAWLARLSGRNFRLPTEAEWEFAATAGKAENIYPWGKRGWEEMPELRSRFRNGPEPIGSFEPNELGIHEMGMNVHEWCDDWYSSDYYASSPMWNPAGPPSGKRKASRGGSWRHQIKITRCCARSSIPPDMKYADYGFRVACDRK